MRLKTILNHGLNFKCFCIGKSEFNEKKDSIIVEIKARTNTVFVIVNINLKKENLKYVKGTAMLRAKALLQKKFHLPSSFKLVCRELEARTYRNQGFFRYALAYREADIIQLAENSDIQ